MEIEQHKLQAMHLKASDQSTIADLKFELQTVRE